MWRIDAPSELAGGEISTDDGEPPESVDQGISVECANCQTAFDVTKNHTAHRFYPAIICHSCGGIIAIQYDDAVFRPVWDIVDLTSETPAATLSVAGEDGEYRVFDERSDTLSSIHKAGECLARATSMEFLGDGNYSVQAMNVLVLAEPSGIAVGYLTWNTFDTDPSTFPALRQLYFLPAYRRRGLGSALVQFWVENVVDDLVAETPDNVYCVEQPNEDMRELIWALGHDAENEGGPKASEYTPNQM